MSLRLWHKSLVNAFTFPLRQAVRWSRPGYQEAPGDLDALVAGHPRRERIEQLLETYEPVLAGRHDDTNLLENIDWLHLLDRAVEEVEWKAPKKIRALDVGCRDFYYAAALHAFWSRQAPVEELVGVELDAHQIYTDGHSRRDHGEYFTAELAGARYVAGDVRALEGPFHAITHLFPFVTERAHVSWGLPKGLLRPGDVLAHVLDLLLPGGLLIVVNQGQHEVEIQHALLAEFGLEPLRSFELDDPFIVRQPRCISVIRIPEDPPSLERA